MTDLAKQPNFEALAAIVAERTQPLVAWVGSGLSAAAGLPTWPELKATLEEALSAKAATLHPAEARRLAAEADDIRRSVDYWVCFQRLRNELGPTTYRDTIRARLAGAATEEVPESYRLLWQLPLNGVMTLNIDRLATRGYSLERPGDAPNEFSGLQIAHLLSLLHHPRKFIANLHGHYEDTSTWVFTHEELRKLQKQRTYADFVRVILTSFTNIFLGMSVDDVAVGGHLAELASRKVQGPSHFWLTDRSDEITDRWAETVGVRLIRYPLLGQDLRESHDHAVRRFLEGLLSARPADETPAAPVRPTNRALTTRRAGPLPPLETLALQPADEVRQILNAEASRLLEPEDDAAYQAYERFLDEYDEAIYSAWYVSTIAPRNEVLEFRLLRRVARGAFGTVYEALDADGRRVALKVLLQEIRRDPGLLQSFRRGVRTMSILKRRGLEGVATFREAFEIPACVVMDWIEGPTLSEAVEARQIDEWSLVLKIASRITDIVRAGHALPERILHRDMRPANVMLRDFWTSPNSWEVVVCDFDLSWHKGAEQKSVVYSTAVGYLAPEQIQSRSGASTRNAAVDSFGIGMTMLFMVTGRNPLPDQHLHVGYEGAVHEATRDFSAAPWLSLPTRFARLIIDATRDRQHARWDLSQIAGELDRLRSALETPLAVKSAELIAEEVAARTEIFAQYLYTNDDQSLVRHYPTGLTLRLQPDEPGGTISLHATWRRSGEEQRAGLSKYLDRGSRTALSRLQADGWNARSAGERGQSVEIIASRSAASIGSNLARVSRGLDSALGALHFSGH